MLDTEFTNAQNDVMKLSKRPNNESLLELYAFFKQATHGNNTGSRPSVFKLKERAKFDAWKSKSGMTNKLAKENYISLVSQLLEK